MIRLAIDRICIDGLAHLSPALLRRHLEREIAGALARRPRPAGRRQGPAVIRRTETEQAFSAELARVIVEELDGH